MKKLLIAVVAVVLSMVMLTGCSVKVTLTAPEDLKIEKNDEKVDANTGELDQDVKDFNESAEIKRETLEEIEKQDEDLKNAIAATDATVDMLKDMLDDMGEAGQELADEFGSYAAEFKNGIFNFKDENGNVAKYQKDDALKAFSKYFEDSQDNVNDARTMLRGNFDKLIDNIEKDEKDKEDIEKLFNELWGKLDQSELQEAMDLSDEIKKVFDEANGNIDYEIIDKLKALLEKLPQDKVAELRELCETLKKQLDDYRKRLDEDNNLMNDINDMLGKMSEQDLAKIEDELKAAIERDSHPPKRLLMDENGNPILDESGEPIDADLINDISMIKDGIMGNYENDIEKDVVSYNIKTNGVIEHSSEPNEITDTGTVVSHREWSYKEPFPEGDGNIEDDENVKRMLLYYRWSKDRSGRISYEELASIAGCEALDGGNKGPNNMSNYGIHNVKWFWDNGKKSIFFGFKRNKDKDEWFANQWTSGGDVTEDWYSTADIGDLIDDVDYGELCAHSYKGKTETKKQEFDLSFDVYSKGWFEKGKNGKYCYRIYNTYDKEMSQISPRIEISVAEDFAKINEEWEKFKDLKEANEQRELAGTRMNIRTYRYDGSWLEYYGELKDGLWLSIKIDSKLIGDKAAETILNSIKIG